ncbi:MAG: hypothetical protein JO028_21140 [Acidobacteriaceae bacterium]|nr:hypothetical protein [Acidobacteriaceae bacterium]
MQDSAVSIDKGKVDHANIELNIGAGELNLRSGTEKLIDGRFEFNVPDWKPKVDSSVNGSHATVTIQQPNDTHAFGNQHNVWNLQLNDKVLMDLALNCGAGRARLDLGDLSLRSINVHMGAGQVDLNLEGHPSRDYDVNISGGVGQATVRLPHDVGIRAEAHGGLGSINVSGLEKKGGAWENDLYDNAKVNVRLKVEGGIGEIRIID